MEVEEILAKKLARLVEDRPAVDPKVFSLIAEGIAPKIELCTATWKAGKRWVRCVLESHPSLSGHKCGKITRARPFLLPIRMTAK